MLVCSQEHDDTFYTHGRCHPSYHICVQELLTHSSKNREAMAVIPKNTKKTNKKKTNT